MFGLPVRLHKFLWRGEATQLHPSMKVPLSSKYTRALFPSARALAGEGAVAAADGAPHPRLPESARSSPAFYSPTIPALALLTLLAACATQAPAAVAPEAPGFLLGVWHGFIFPVAWVASLFVPKIAVYAVPNNGGWYDFGYFLGIVVFGVGAKKGGERVVYRDNVIETTARRID